jgi:hypothetical protein
MDLLVVYLGTLLGLLILLYQEGKEKLKSKSKMGINNGITNCAGRIWVNSSVGISIYILLVLSVHFSEPLRTQKAKQFYSEFKGSYNFILYFFRDNLIFI